ncbi:hypothetical protein BO71DRAFT_212200 [Aspergillus ellipticus CBS 707.79]|uniref:Uncharacterized protein n=1 Tax=Aspergillus ellipticus CBS 707.79 TaxID=1448320 RepID=A0A319DCM7_9EURO|nr:hypothetical protein BO71DRAFT_212200 [Aspergillus ellipticus CBS 707.79]
MYLRHTRSARQSKSKPLKPKTKRQKRKKKEKRKTKRKKKAITVPCLLYWTYLRSTGSKTRSLMLPVFFGIFWVSPPLLDLFFVACLSSSIFPPSRHLHRKKPICVSGPIGPGTLEPQPVRLFSALPVPVPGPLSLPYYFSEHYPVVSREFLGSQGATGNGKCQMTAMWQCMYLKDRVGPLGPHWQWVKPNRATDNRGRFSAQLTVGPMEAQVGCERLNVPVEAGLLVSTRYPTPEGRV